MNVFISWSGLRSKAVAEALHSWLPCVIQSVKPWMSAADLEKGTRWSSDIANQLKETRVGVICLTSDNLDAPWILFEAGALSKSVEATYVCPYLFHVEPSELKGPLVQFQSTKCEKDDTKRLLQTINSALAIGALSERQLNEAFEVWWPKLEEKLMRVSEIREGPKIRRPERELLEESLELLRDLARGRIFSAQVPLSFDSSAPQNDEGTFTLARNLKHAARLLRNYKPDSPIGSRSEDTNDAESSK